MIEEIQRIKEETNFDFRKFANPEDEYRNFFDHWVDYYREKFAVCKAVNPRSILEIGVRYGYSAVTFMHACPEATYLGIDNDSDEFGGAAGAINWARKITEGFRADYLVGNTMNMDSLPGDYYDLIHVDGQQDGDGTFHDLEMAMEKGRYLLVDGFFWSRENMMSSMFFLEKYKKFMEYALVIPGYAYDLLIKLNDKARNYFGSKKRDYSALRDDYSSDYFIMDCEGNQEFIKSGGELCERLLPVYSLAAAGSGQRILDVGCGRGELTSALSRLGADVTGLDYAKDAIRIAEETYARDTDGGRKLPQNLHFVQGDFLTHEFPDRFDTIVASDFVEHIEQDMLEAMLRKMASLLKEDGRLIIHTYPNQLNYRFGYKRKRSEARELGVYLPENPRSFFEDMMHINEQTPAGLNRALKRCFGHTLTWVSAHPDTVGSLRADFGREGIMNGTSIFAVASHAPIDREDIIQLISQQKLAPEGLEFRMASSTRELTVKRSSRVPVKVAIENLSLEKIASLPPCPVHISYHWYRDEGEQVVQFDGERTRLTKPLMPSEVGVFEPYILAPAREGRYQLQLSLVQETHAWLEEFTEHLPMKLNVHVE